MDTFTNFLDGFVTLEEPFENDWELTRLNVELDNSPDNCNLIDLINYTNEMDGTVTNRKEVFENIFKPPTLQLDTASIKKVSIAFISYS